MANILVVDDSRTARLKLQKAAESLGHEVRTAEHGRAALDALNDRPFDAVLLDILMPGMDGFEVLAAMKSSERTKHIPVIVVSGLSDTMASVVQAMELGAEDFLPKSFELPLLKARLTAGIEKNIRRRSQSDVAIRPAAADDIPMLLTMVNTAGGGLPLEAWRRSCHGAETPWERGSAIMRDEGADIHLGNCWMAQTASGGLGGLVLYVPTIAGSALLENCDFLKPIQELEAMAEGTAHVSFLCTIDSWRGQGIGSALLRFAETRRGPKGMSIIVASANNGARSLYQRFGYREAERRPMIMPDGRHRGDDWILMLKS